MGNAFRSRSSSRKRPPRRDEAYVHPYRGFWESPEYNEAIQELQRLKFGTTAWKSEFTLLIQKYRTLLLEVHPEETRHKLSVEENTVLHEAYALKCMRKAKVYETGQVEHIISECKLLLECNHPFIVRLVRTFEDAGSLYLLLELTPVGPACTSADPPSPHPASLHRFHYHRLCVPQGGELFSVLRAESDRSVC